MVRTNAAELAEHNRPKVKTFVARPVNDVSDFHFPIDIIIPYHGQYDKVTSLIESIFKHTRSNLYTLYVIDDCSPNAEFIQTLGKNANRRDNVLHSFRCNEQKGFAGACEAAFNRGESPYVCFINSDCLFEDIGWLKNMGETLLSLKSQNVRMVSPRTNNPVQKGDHPQKGTRDVPKEDIILGDDEHLSLYCFMCHRELFARCGGFLKNYPFGYYEDEEFAARMRAHGFRQAVSGKSWVYHEGAATVHSLWRKNSQIRQIMEEDNRKRCIEDIRKLRGKSDS